MYEWLKRVILPWLRVEDSEPHPPAGHDPHETLRVERADAGFLGLRLLQWKLYAAAWALGVSFLSVGLLIADWRFVLLVIPLLAFATVKAATLYVTTRLDYELRWYVITDRSVLIREGVWNVQEVTLTFANAQNVRVTQGPLERLFGFSNVEIETAGGGSAETGGASHKARLRGLSNPGEVRDLILNKLRQHRTAGLGDPDDLELLHAAPAPQRLRSGAALDTTSSALVGEVWDEAKALRVALERRRK